MNTGKITNWKYRTNLRPCFIQEPSKNTQKKNLHSYCLIPGYVHIVISSTIVSEKELLMLSPPGHNSKNGEKPPMKMQSTLAHHQQSSYTSITLTLSPTDFSPTSQTLPILTLLSPSRSHGSTDTHSTVLVSRKPDTVSQPTTHTPSIVSTQRESKVNAKNAECNAAEIDTQENPSKFFEGSKSCSA